MRQIACVIVLLVPVLAHAQADSGTVRVTYEVMKGGTRSAAFDTTLQAGFFPYVPIGRPDIRGSRVARPLRLQGCARNARRGTYNIEFNTAMSPAGLAIGGPTSAILSLQVGGYPWDRSVRYAGAATYPQDFILGPRKTAKAWQFRQAGQRMFDQVVNPIAGGASVTINADERSGSFVLGPYPNVKREMLTVRGTFTCSRLMVPKGL